MLLFAALALGGCKEVLKSGFCETNADCVEEQGLAGTRCELMQGHPKQYECVVVVGDGGTGGDAQGGQGGADETGGAGGSGGAVGEGGAGGGGSGGGGSGGMKPDAALPECATSSACVAANKPICDKTAPSGGACVACVSDGVCAARDPNAPLCDTTSGKCVACKAAADCKSATAPICNVAAGTCGGCKTSPECVARGGAGKLCDVGSGKCEVCLAHADCTTGAAPLCGTDKTCVACNDGGGSAGCAARNAALPQCDTGKGTCVECLASSHCGVANKPICRGDACAACRQDGECADKLGPDPGVCMDQNGGVCATDAQVIYVRRNTGVCTNTAGAGGTITTPYCRVQDGVNAANDTKHVVLVRGPESQSTLAMASGPTKLAVIGQNGATLSPGGGGPGISLTGGTLYVRGLKISGSDDQGIIAGPTSTLRADRLVVENNLGGILLNGAAFDIQNTLVVSNRATTLGAIPWGGILVLDPPAAGPKIARNLTVANNNGGGLSCSVAVQGTGLISSGNINNPDQISPACAVTACCSGDPLFTNGFHLQSGSPCLDKIPLAMSPVLDLDGRLRPSGPQSDCGAYELQQ